MINLRALQLGIPFRTRSGCRRSCSVLQCYSYSYSSYVHPLLPVFFVLRWLLAVPLLHWHQNRWHVNTDKRSDSLSFWYNKPKTVSSNNYDADVILGPSKGNLWHLCWR
ncbi:uncharacterized protein LOC135696731 isoform X3 [Rhopilema esculentum]|uniref:uncharacterized protein LOC135696731 isoform X3 n=1 Tax=Rhopilema esculentum TaxID=499914 RepID=UPI0031D6875E